MQWGINGARNPHQQGLASGFSKKEKGVSCMSTTDALYERFKANLEAVNGECSLAAKADAGKVVADLFQAKGIKTACVAETDFLREIGIVPALREAGIEVFTDHIRLHAETAQGGISEAQYGVADLGSILQVGDEIDARIVATMSADYFGILKESTIVDDYDAMFDVICALPEMPNFVGFVTGPSRTADIECVSTVGVHGPLRLSIVIIQDA
jgi:L-lactate dehydrogenase complex protein LldG